MQVVQFVADIFGCGKKSARVYSTTYSPASSLETGTEGEMSEIPRLASIDRVWFRKGGRAARSCDSALHVYSHCTVLYVPLRRFAGSMRS